MEGVGRHEEKWEQQQQQEIEESTEKRVEMRDGQVFIHMCSIMMKETLLPIGRSKEFRPGYSIVSLQQILAMVVP